MLAGTDMEFAAGGIIPNYAITRDELGIQTQKKLTDAAIKAGEKLEQDIAKQTESLDIGQTLKTKDLKQQENKF